MPSRFVRCLVAVLPLLVFSSSVRGDPEVGKPLNSFIGSDLDNKTVSLRSVLSTKPRALVLVFFSTTCVSCRAGLPSVLKTAAKLKSEGVTTVIIGTLQDATTLYNYFKDEGLKVTVPVVADTYGHISQKKYGVKALPRIVVADADGVTRKVFDREGPDIGRELTEAVHVVLNGNSAP